MERECKSPIGSPSPLPSTPTSLPPSHHPLPHSSAMSKGQKRKHPEDEAEEVPGTAVDPAEVAAGVRSQVDVLLAVASSPDPSDRAAARDAAHFLSEIAKDDTLVGVIVAGGAIPALVKHLQPPDVAGLEGGKLASEHEVERYCAFVLGLLALKPENQQLIVDAGALRYLVTLLSTQVDGSSSRAVNGVIRRAADAITNLAHENSVVKNYVRLENGIPPLVRLLESSDLKVQRAAAGALRTLAFKNDENKNLIVGCNALPALVLMIQSDDASIHYEAIGVIGNLVHSSPSIKREVLAAGALQPVIGLLSSFCTESQREAALLLGQFAANDSDCKAHIVQRGAVRPLVDMLQSPDIHLKEMAAFALGRLAQDKHNQAGITYNGGLVSLLRLLDSKVGSLQHNAAFALYGLADNEDNISEFIKVGGVQKLMEGDFIIQATKDCVAKTLKRIEEHIDGRVLKHLLYLMRVAEETVRRRVVLALAHLYSYRDQTTIFIDNNGLELLLDLLKCTNQKQQKDGAMAFCSVAKKVFSVSSADAAPTSPKAQVFLGEQFVNSRTLSDVAFLVEDRVFHAHRIALVASSDAFRAMFDSGYREKNAKDIEIPNIKWNVFFLMMRFIYTGFVEVSSEVAQDLLKAADQYLLEGLKRLCESAIAQDISTDNVLKLYELSETYNAVFLRQSCILFILEHFDELICGPGFSHATLQIIPEIRSFFKSAMLSDSTPLSAYNAVASLRAKHRKI